MGEGVITTVANPSLRVLGRTSAKHVIPRLSHVIPNSNTADEQDICKYHGRAMLFH